jgi:hypothetical protein
VKDVPGQEEGEGQQRSFATLAFFEISSDYIHYSCQFFANRKRKKEVKNDL